ncbi:hypothetical protein [Lysinibacillus xylanilyticus]
MKEQKQMTMYDFMEQPIKKPTDVNKIVDKKGYIESRVRVYIVRR